MVEPSQVVLSRRSRYSRFRPTFDCPNQPALRRWIHLNHCSRLSLRPTTRGSMTRRRSPRVRTPRHSNAPVAAPVSAQVRHRCQQRPAQVPLSQGDREAGASQCHPVRSGHRPPVRLAPLAPSSSPAGDRSPDHPGQPDDSAAENTAGDYGTTPCAGWVMAHSACMSGTCDPACPGAPARAAPRGPGHVRGSPPAAAHQTVPRALARWIIAPSRDDPRLRSRLSIARSYAAKAPFAVTRFRLSLLAYGPGHR